MRNVVLAILLSVPGMARTVVLSWTDVDSGVTFDAYRGTGACTTNPVFNLIASGITALTYQDASVAIGTSYCYYVTAVDTATGTQSNPSNKASVNILPHVPGLKVPIITWLINEWRRG